MPVRLLKPVEANDGSFKGAILGMYDLMSAPGPFVAVCNSLAGREIYFTGAQESCYVTSPYLCHAQRFDNYTAADNAIRAWNNLGHKFYGRPANEAELKEFAELDARAALAKAGDL